MIFCSRLGLFFFQLDIDQYMEYVEKVVPLSAQSILGNPDCTTKDLTAIRGVTVDELHFRAWSTALVRTA